MLLLRPQEERVAFDLIVAIIDPIGDLQPIALDEEHKAIATLGVIELASTSSEGEAPTRAIREKLYEPILRMSRLALLLYGIPATDETRIPLLLRQIGDLLPAGGQPNTKEQAENKQYWGKEVPFHNANLLGLRSLRISPSNLIPTGKHITLPRPSMKFITFKHVESIVYPVV